jgi:hypothetical protein
MLRTPGGPPADEQAHLDAVLAAEGQQVGLILPVTPITPGSLTGIR